MNNKFFYYLIFSSVISVIYADTYDGQLDNSFGNQGFVSTLISDSSHINSIAIQSDGKIVAAGYASLGNKNVFALARYNSDGTLDTATFNPGGIETIPGTVITDFGNTNIINSVAIQSDGKIVAGGKVFTDKNHFLLARYNTDGTLDTTFNPLGSGTGVPGLVQTSLFYSCRINSISIQTDGKIVVGGFSALGETNYGIIARYNTDGSLDTTFNPIGTVTGQPGVVATLIGNSSFVINSIAIQSDGKIIAGGNTFLLDRNVNLFALARYNTDGSLDSTTFNPFGINSFLPGTVVTQIGTSAGIDQITTSSNGKIIAGGLSNFKNGIRFTVAKYNSDGSLDISFNSNGTPGFVTNLIGDIIQNLCSLDVLNNGKIVLGGTIESGETQKFALLRLNSDGSIDATFNPLEIGVGLLSNPGIIYIQPNRDNKLHFIKSLSNNDLLVAGHTNANETITSFLIAKILYVNPSMNTPTPEKAKGLRYIFGFCKPNDLVGFTIDGQSAGFTLGDLVGAWSLKTAGMIGNHTITATTNGISKTINFTLNKNLPKLFIRNPSGGSVRNSTKPRISGFTEPNLNVEIFIDGTSIGTTTADSEGNWSMSTPSDLSTGIHNVAAQVEKDGKKSIVKNIFKIDTNAPYVKINKPKNGAVVNNLRKISGQGTALTNIGIVVDGIFRIENVVLINQDTAWEFILPEKLKKGNHLIQAFARDQFGNFGTDSLIVTIQ